MSEILKRFGLKADQVRKLLNTPQPTNTTTAEPSVLPVDNYWYGPNQKKISERIASCENWIIAQYILFKRKPETIALLVGVSTESVRKRLRKHNLFNSNGKAGRPHGKEKELR
jgi:hypothetical protein